METDRLFIRPYTNEDLPFLGSLVSDPRVVRYIGNGKPRTKEGAQLFFNWNLTHRKDNEQLGLQVLIEKETGEKIGHAGLVPQEVEGETELEVGYWIAPAYWGKGYATEAALAFKDLAFEHLHVARIIALIYSENLASCRVADKLGMRVWKSIERHEKEVLVYSKEKTPS
ncbi:Protein N-acetyltransferase, RimJ/RimL family [Terribacillus aidingensis]|uniref:Protein N-acetyltransferase, RimJ/RimL family n=1 Tax=Terribacillus aidingensis TaxID=586416 RepID=A0A285N5G2_9BACI|nr:GNAT family N-acetyltransferase [Terribacillus aidingensis]SNZ04714.1 Protein N-acetyltransferase, RimJ/RimL family [Terribacillus aidingensis]